MSILQSCPEGLLDECDYPTRLLGRAAVVLAGETFSLVDGKGNRR